MEWGDGPKRRAGEAFRGAGNPRRGERLAQAMRAQAMQLWQLR